MKEMKISHRYLPKPFEENPLEKKSSTSPQFLYEDGFRAVMGVKCCKYIP